VGGVLAEKPGEWARELGRMIGSKEMRIENARAGMQKTNNRAIEVVA
jgi:hypothetical protein